MLIDFSSSALYPDVLVFESPSAFGQGTPALPSRFNRIRVPSRGAVPYYGNTPSVPSVPTNALLDGLDNPLLDGSGNYLLGG